MIGQESARINACLICLQQTPSLSTHDRGFALKSVVAKMIFFLIYKYICTIDASKILWLLSVVAAYTPLFEERRCYSHSHISGWGEGNDGLENVDHLPRLHPATLLPDAPLSPTPPPRHNNPTRPLHHRHLAQRGVWSKVILTPSPQSTQRKTYGIKIAASAGRDFGQVCNDKY